MQRRDFLKVAALSGAAIACTPLETFAGKVRTKWERTPDQVANFAFRSNGKFKVLQFTDTHYVAGDPRSERALVNVEEMLDKEKPDLVIHTGDIIFGNPAAQSAREILQPMVDRGYRLLSLLEIMTVTSNFHGRKYMNLSEE